MTNNAVSTWKAIVYNAGEPRPGLEALQALRDNKTPAIIIKNLLNPVILAAFQEAIAQQRQHAIVSRYPNGSLTTIGPYIAKHVKDPAPYFASAHATDILFPNPALDMRIYVREQLKQLFDLQSFTTASQDGQDYAPAIVRLHSNGINNPLHNDHIMRDAKGSSLILADLDCQFSCIVCAQECDAGGELVLYHKPWKPEDEQYKISGNLGYESDVVAGVEYFKYKPATGDVYLINPTNYHEIYEVRGRERRTLGFFFGFFDKAMEQGVIWS